MRLCIQRVARAQATETSAPNENIAAIEKGLSSTMGQSPFGSGSAEVL